jgi:hypothetical protein
MGRRGLSPLCVDSPQAMSDATDVPIVRNRFTIHAEHPDYARKIMRSTLSGAKSEVVEDAALLTSEVVADAMLHREVNPELLIDTTKDRIHVEVRDFDKPREDVDRMELRAPVLLMMNSLAASWGVEPRGDYGVVWFDVPF